MTNIISLESVSKVKVFGGNVETYKHASSSTNCDMIFSVFIPETNIKVPALFFLSGLTCTHENFIQKAGALKLAAKLGIALICPDTSPRGCGIEGEEEDWDFGVGAGFYLDATQPKWSKNYNMYSYITKELPIIIQSTFANTIDSDRCSIMGHSMGGHGALVCALRNPGMYKSVSAFAPIVNPIKCPWGIKAFTNYLGPDQSAWKQYDACELISAAGVGNETSLLNIKVDVGEADKFLPTQLFTDHLQDALSKSSSKNSIKLEYARHEGYDHSYFFVQTFVDAHLEFHGKYLATQQ